MAKASGPAPDQKTLDMDEFKAMFNSNVKRSRSTDTVKKRFENSTKTARIRGKQISLLGQIFNSSKVGRYGGKQFKEKKDSIHNLGENGPGQVYFDPFGDVIRTQDGENETLRKDFLDRVEGQKKLAQKNDHEKSRFGKEEQDFLVNALIDSDLRKGDDKPGKMLMSEITQDRMERLAGEYAEKVNQTKKFEKDFGEGNQEIPDEFSVVVAVDPPTDVYVDYNKERTALTMSTLGGKKNTDFMALLDRNVEKTQAYRDMVAKGQQDAAAAGETYDRERDPNFAILRSQVAMGLEREQGHSFLRFVPKRKGKAVHSYSFGFWPMTATPGMGAVTAGLVKNPDPEAKKMSIIERPHTVSYANYLRAASKVRGLVGSKHTYSFLGYNCTSFAADVANEAGISIKAEDSGDKMKTYRQRSAWIDSPYSLAKYVRAAVPQGGDAAAQAAMRKFESLSFREQMDAATVEAITEGVVKRVANTLAPRMGQEEITHGDTRIGYTGTVIGNNDHMSSSAHGQIVENKLLHATHGGMMSSPLFQELYLQHRFDDDETQEDFAERIFASLTLLLKQTLNEMNNLDTKTFEELMKNTDERHDITEARSAVIRQRREKMIEIFGVPTVSEFIADVSSGKRLYSAVNMLQKAHANHSRTFIPEPTPQGNVEKSQIIQNLDRKENAMTDRERQVRLRENAAIQADPTKKTARTFSERVFEKMLVTIHMAGDQIKDKALELSDLACARLGQTDAKLRPSDKVAFAAYLISENRDAWSSVQKAGSNKEQAVSAMLKAMLFVKNSIEDGEMDSEMEKTITALHTVVKTLSLSYQK